MSLKGLSSLPHELTPSNSLNTATIPNSNYAFLDTQPACSCRCYSSSSQKSCYPFCVMYMALPLPIPPHLPASSQPSIRLISLKAGRTHDMLEGFMFTISLSDNAQFSALSYVWGDQTERFPMVINGRYISVGRSLYSALLYLRRTTAEIVLWADAICIDQNNILERDYQVEHMPDIYSAANEVVAWLGEPANNSDSAMEFISIHGKETQIDFRPWNDMTYDIQEALNYLWSREYWTRAWVVQELASARRSKNACMIHCGARSISYKVLQKFIASLLKRILFTGDDPVLQPRRMLTLSSSSSQIPFLEILWESALLKCTDPKDRIYGIRGISPKFYREMIKVNYSLDFPTLCQRFVVQYIRKERNLDILSCFHNFPPHSYRPTWVPDLRNRTSGISPFAYSASGVRSASAKISRSALLAKGIQVSVVAEVKGPYHLPTLPQINTLSGNPEELHQVALKTLASRYPDEDPITRNRRFWEMMSGNRYEARSAYESEPQNLWNTHCTMGYIFGGDFWTERRIFCFYFERVIGRCFFTTSAQQIGLGPPNMRPGDIVSILYGCSTCIILRPFDGGHYFVGPAYVDGAMTGNYIRLKGIELYRSIEMSFSIR